MCVYWDSVTQAQVSWVCSMSCAAICLCVCMCVCCEHVYIKFVVMSVKYELGLLCVSLCVLNRGGGMDDIKSLIVYEFCACGRPRMCEWSRQGQGTTGNIKKLLGIFPTNIRPTP